MNQQAVELVQALPDQEHLENVIKRLTTWLLADLGPEGGAFTESRARALLRANDLLDEPSLNQFQQQMNRATAVRVALYDLLDSSGLAAADLPPQPGTVAEGPVRWLAVAVAAFAWKSGYPLHQLDPASPPDPHSPAGQLLTRAAHFIRRQVLRSATERNQLGRKLGFRPGAAPSTAASPTAAPIAPVPPNFRPPVPVRYPEVARETVLVDPDEPAAAAPARGEPISISTDDLPSTETQPVTMPPIRIEPEQVAPRRPGRPAQRTDRSRVVMPGAVTEAGNSLAASVRQLFQREPMDSTKLRLKVQQYPDGPGLYGLQVRVTCQGIKSYVAGTTDRDGNFVCELPVPRDRGLTYDVDLTWPRDEGGDTERKSITLNSDRTEFSLPFYRQLNQS